MAKFKTLFTILFFLAGFSQSNAQVLPKPPSAIMPIPKELGITPINVPTYGELAKAIHYYKTGYYSSSLDIALDLAARGDGNAAALAGFLFEHGLGADINLNKAYEFYVLGQKSGSGDSSIGIGRLYLKGYKNIDKSAAISAVNKAISNKRDDVYGLLGDIYFFQNPTSKDIENGILAYEKAAENKDGQAAYTLAILYDDGQANPDDDLTKAHHFLEIAADSKIATAMFDYGNYLYFGRGGAQDYAKAATYFHEAADKNIPQAQFMWAVVNAKGQGVAENLEIALEYAQKCQNDVKDAKNLIAAIKEFQAKAAKTKN